MQTNISRLIKRKFTFEVMSLSSLLMMMTMMTMVTVMMIMCDGQTYAGHEESQHTQQLSTARAEEQESTDA